jgi:antitoxin ParD1/3/4
MHTERVTVSLPADLMAEARSAVRRGAARSISAYVAEAVSARQLRDRSLALLHELYGGPRRCDVAHTRCDPGPAAVAAS